MHVRETRTSRRVPHHLSMTITSTVPPRCLQRRPMAVYSTASRCTWSGGDNRLARSVTQHQHQQRRPQEWHRRRRGTRPPPLEI